MTETQIMFKLRQHIAGLEHQMRQLEAMVLAQNNELEIVVAVGCAWAFELGREIARLEEITGVRVLQSTGDITEAEKEAALKERFAKQDEALAKMQATKAEPKILRP